MRQTEKENGGDGR